MDTCPEVVGVVAEGGPEVAAEVGLLDETYCRGLKMAPTDGEFLQDKHGKIHGTTR